MAEDEEARRASEDEQKDRATKLPERIKFKGLREALEQNHMLAIYADTIRERKRPLLLTAAGMPIEEQATGKTA